MRSERNGNGGPHFLGRLKRLRRALHDRGAHKTTAAPAVPTDHHSRSNGAESAAGIAIARAPHVESQAAEHAEQLASWENDGGASIRTQPAALPHPTAARDT
jgi:hypothetical protein